MDGETIVAQVLEESNERIKSLDAITARRHSFGTLLKIVKEKEYFLGITGLRGIGKTILLLQLAKASNGVYFSADNRNLRGADLYDVIKTLSQAGHENIFIDEIHSKPKWDEDLKTACEENLAYIAFSGSSAIQIKTLKADLSRRAVIEHLRPASFREWLSIKRGIELPALTLGELVRKKTRLAKDYGFVNKLLPQYYEAGGVLYSAKTYFHKTILSMIETIATKDFASIKGVGPDTSENFFKLLQMIATSNPMELSYSSIGQTLGRDKVWVMRFLADVEKTEVIHRVYSCGSGPKPFRKEAKYYLPFPYRHAICASLNKTPDIGSLREEFFINHADCCYLKTSGVPMADFKIGGLSFEVGGKGKNNKQNADYLVTDGLDTSENKLPLFTFGLLTYPLPE
ncbi:AAA family ATPase [Candidatus Micrarchaeota archaeon]|nr:AAA family ATPase [Candidatus Micrarchaeota archaeon]